MIVVQPATPDNEPPVAEDDAASTIRGTPLPITVIQNDSDPNGICTYTPDTGFTGEDSFIYEVCDALRACDTALATIEVQAEGWFRDQPHR